MKQRKRRRALWLIPLVLAGGAAGWYFLKGRKVQTTLLVVQQRTAIVEKGELSITLSGSGSVRPAVTADIRVNSGATVEKSFLEERKFVKAGDVLLTLTGGDTGITEKKLRNTLEQKQLAYRKLVEQYEAFNITAPSGGEITEVFVEVGDEVKAGAELMTITDTTVLTADVSFENTPMEIIESDQAVLYLPDYMTTIPAVIRSRQQNGSSTDVTVVVENSGFLKPGIVVRCEVAGAEGAVVSSAGTLQWNRVETVSAKTSGMLQSLSVSKGDMVTEGTLLAVLYDDEAEVNLENARLQVEEAQLSLDELLQESVQSQVTAPMDGYLTSILELAPGDSVKSGEVIATIINMDEMEFSINIDELDINKVSEGQDVYVTAEAIEETQTDPMIGKVTSIALQGNTLNGVTTYPVTIRVPGREGLKAGMNVDAVIQVVKKENVLLVPLEALQKRGDAYMVWVKTGGTGDNTRSSERAPGSGDNTGGSERAPGSGGFPGFSDEQREQMQQQMQNMTDEERQAMRERFGNASERSTERRGEITAGQSRTNFTLISSDNYYEGATLVTVTTGLYNENYMEVIDGLKEGDIVVLPRQTSNTTTATQRQPTGGFSMPGGGMFGGGMPGGGNFIGGGGRR